MKENRHSEKLSFLDNPANFQSILEQITDGVYITDKERKILFWNRACEEITGYLADEVTGKRCADGILEHVDMSGNKICSTDLCPLHRAMITGKPSQTPLTVRAKHKDGRRVIVEVSVAPVFDISGKVIGGVEMFRDVSRKIALEEEKYRFISSINHDLKTPLTNMQGYLDLLLDGDAGELNEVQKEFAETIYSEEQKLATLIDELLEMSRFESTEFSYEQNIMDLADLLRKAVHSFRGEAQRKGLVIEEDLPQELLIMGDRNRLWQAFTNLIGNAVKYTNEGKAEVSLYRHPLKNEIVIKIKDTGIGIPSDDMENIFKMFYRADSHETLSIKGTGIGLYIADSVIRRHEGRIEAESTPGRGSVFTIYLPALNNEESSE